MARSMQYFRSYGAFFDSPEWGMNMLSTALCQLIPIIGPLVATGWLCEVVESLHRDPKQKSYPAFDWGKFGEYLNRGLWPFLVQLVVGMVFAVILSIVIIGGVFGVIAVAQGGGEPVAIALGIVLFFVLMLVNLVVQAIMLPMILRAALTQSFGGAFDMGFVKSFMGKTWAQIIGTSFFLMFTAPFLALAGELMLCVGLYAAAAWIGFAYWHLKFQLYELYLERGGEPIPMKAPASDDDDYDDDSDD